LPATVIAPSEPGDVSPLPAGETGPEPAGAARQPELTEFLTPPQEADELGRLGGYRVLQVLGSGGMGVVFRAEDPHLERTVALKAMLPALAGNPSAKQRFFREAKAAAALKHPHVVTIFQVGEDRGAPFLAMEFLDGEPLDERLKRQPRLPVADILRIGREIAGGLAAAHERGLVHRDIKPANLWLEGEEGHVKILDFGLARALADQTHLTQTGVIVGTPAYMAPEQARGQPVDHRGDLFSLGCVLYRMCTGEVPFPGQDTMSILSALALDTPRSPRTLNADVPGGLSDLVMRLLAKTADDRPQSARSVAEALAALERELASTRDQGRARPTTRRGRRLLVLAVTVAAMIGLVGALVLLPPWGGSRRLETGKAPVSSEMRGR
jgi:serine/threonine protein kinase